MPYYDYICEMCTETFEMKLPLAYKGPVTCPVCGTGETKRILLEVPATVLNWWNSAASSDTSGITQRFRGGVKNKRALENM